MKHLKYLVFILLLCTGFLSLLYQLYRKGYNRFYSFEKGRINEIIEGKKNYDILFIGTSRTYHQINPAIIDSITGMQSYNAGIDGANLLEMNLVLQAYLKSHKPPKMVVADVSLLCFAVKRQPFFDPNMYYEYLDNEIVYNTLKPYKRVFLLKTLPFFRFPETDDMLRQNAILGYFGKKSVDNKRFYQGFLSYGFDTISLPLQRRYQTIYEIDDLGLKLMNTIITTCKKSDIKLIITYAPEYEAKGQGLNPAFFPTLTAIALKNHIPFWNYRWETIGADHRLFKDEHHLNRIGADIFSGILAKDITKTLNPLRFGMAISN